MKKLIIILLFINYQLSGQIINLDKIDSVYIYYDDAVGIINLSKIYNQYPYATDLSISGFPNPDSIVTINYTFNDQDGDLEGNTAYQWYCSPDSLGTLSILSGETDDSLTIPDTLSGYYLYCLVTPKALTGRYNGIMDFRRRHLE